MTMEQISSTLKAERVGKDCETALDCGRSPARGVFGVKPANRLEISSSGARSGGLSQSSAGLELAEIEASVAGLHHARCNAPHWPSVLTVSYCIWLDGTRCFPPTPEHQSFAFRPGPIVARESKSEISERVVLAEPAPRLESGARATGSKFCVGWVLFGNAIAPDR